MENPKHVHSALVGFTIAGSVGFVALSLYLWEIWPIAVWGLFLIGTAAVFAIITVIYGVTVFPILLLIGRVFDRARSAASAAAASAGPPPAGVPSEGPSTRRTAIWQAVSRLGHWSSRRR